MSILFWKFIFIFDAQPSALSFFTSHCRSTSLTSLLVHLLYQSLILHYNRFVCPSDGRFIVSWLFSCYITIFFPLVEFCNNDLIQLLIHCIRVGYFIWWPVHCKGLSWVAQYHLDLWLLSETIILIRIHWYWSSIRFL
jgi:hypothetical protein